MRKTLPIIAASGCGAFMLLDYLVASPGIDAIGAVLGEGVAIMAAFALLLGVLNLLAVHAKRLASRGERRLPTLALILSLLITLGVGVAQPSGAALSWILDHAYLPLQSTMTALMAFFVVTAAYRAFRLRSVDAAILLLTSLVLLLAQLPLGGMISPHLRLLRLWLLAVPVTAGVRGLILGVALGAMATSLRILLAIDQPYAGE
jgi:hypothetical protein